MNRLQEEVLTFFGKDYQIIKKHEDGDLTILSDGVKYIITTEGEFFLEIKPGEESPEADWDEKPPFRDLDIEGKIP